MRRNLNALLALLVVGALLAGCATPRLGDERKIEPFKSLLSTGDAQGTRTWRQNAAAEGAPPLEVALVQMPREHRGTGPLLVFQSGIMSDSSTWRFLAPLLAEDYDLLLVDPPGCGASDKPEMETLPVVGYSPTWLGRHTLRAVERWEARQGETRRDLVFVGHSLGCTSLLMALGDPKTQALLPGPCARVEKIVLLQPADIGMAIVDPNFKKLAELRDGIVDAGNLLGLTRRVVDEAIYDSVVDPATRAHRQEAESFRQLIGSTPTRHAAQAMLKRFRKTDRCGTPDWEVVRRLEARYANIQQPNLIIWGMQDVVLVSTTPEKLLTVLPDARVERVEDAKHSPHQERPHLCAKWIRAFLESGAQPEAAPAPGAVVQDGAD